MEIKDQGLLSEPDARSQGHEIFGGTYLIRTFLCSSYASVREKPRAKGRPQLYIDTLEYYLLQNRPVLSASG